MAASLRTMAIMIGLFCICNSLSCYADTEDKTVVSYVCSSQMYSEDNSYFTYALNYMMRLVAEETAEHGFDYYGHSPDGKDMVYAHGVCNGKLSKNQCTGCVFEAFGDVFDLCPWKPIGAQVERLDCRIRYENYPFM
ncbi:hypothetical protein CDL15_Pgr007404 [Punica granatum]|uniref:Gnk2-homologous domain-containing protein n=1 Tax=Punica granatum TaxID=22663 RepID=A0A218X9K5_PUNGR|nr:hypothetical protein CDL15_Pgr007404 [Punica granatum]